MRAWHTLAISAIAAGILASGSVFAAQGPGQINYQGVLRDAAGKPRTGSFDMAFKFFDASTAGNELLDDRHEAAGSGAVTVTGGVFNAALGGGAIQDGAGPGVYQSLRDVFTRNDAVWLEIVVGGETLAPRAKLLSSAFTIASPGADGPCFNYEDRFVDCNNGTVTDTVTSLIWLKDSNCPLISPKDWKNAGASAAELQSGQCGLTDGSVRGNWRLPSVDEWNAIMTNCFPSPGGPSIRDKHGLTCYSVGTPWATGVVADYYWSSVTDFNFPNSAKVGSLINSVFPDDGKSVPHRVWPVRSPK